MNTQDQLINDFLNKIKFDEKDKEEIVLRLKLKGVYFYNKIYDFIKLNKKEQTIDNISSIYIYDKRIRYILFKYISMIEEQYRAKIINNVKINEEKIIKMTFKKLIDELNNKKIINDQEKNKLNIIKELRNVVFHNNFIILTWEKINIEKNKKLIYALNVMKDLLITKTIKQQFVDDVLFCSKKEKSKKYKNNIKYNLIKEIQIKYKNDLFE